MKCNTRRDFYRNIIPLTYGADDLIMRRLTGNVKQLVPFRWLAEKWLSRSSSIFWWTAAESTKEA